MNVRELIEELQHLNPEMSVAPDHTVRYLMELTHFVKRARRDIRTSEKPVS